MQNVRLDETQSGIKIAGGNNNFGYADDTTLMAESEEELKSLLNDGERGTGLKLSFQKTKIMASGPITSWQIDGEKVETVAEFIFLGSKITVNSDCNHKIKRHLLLGRKAMKNLDSLLKSRDITLPTKVRIVKAIFPVVRYKCESWTIKKAECWIDAFQLCWRTLWEFLGLWRRLESTLDGKEIQPVIPKGNQPWIFIVRTGAEADAPILWPPDVKRQLTGKDLDAGKDWGQEEKGASEDEMVGWHYWLNGHEFEQTQGDSEGQGSMLCCSSWGREELDWT